MTGGERIELALRRVQVEDIWTPTELLDAIITEVMLINIQARHEYTEGALEVELEAKR